MKVYVLDYRPKIGKPEVGYGAEPKWRMAFLHEAVKECQLLNNAPVYVGEHCCEFAVEKLPEGDFTIICLSHPGPDPATGRA